MKAAYENKAKNSGHILIFFSAAESIKAQFV